MRQIDVNLATQEYADKQLAMTLMIAAAILMVVISGSTIFRYVGNENRVNTYDEKIVRTRKLLSQKTKHQQKKQKKPNPSDINRLAKKTAAINRLIARDSFPWNRFMDQLERKIPEGLFIEAFSPSDTYDKLIISGRADSAHKITFFLRRLEEWDLIKTIIIRNLGLTPMAFGETPGVQKGGIGFTIESRISIEKLFTDRASAQLGQILMQLSKQR